MRTMTMPPRSPRLRWTALVTLVLAGTAGAANTLIVGMGKVDPPTVISLGVQLLISGDDNHNAAVTLRYRPLGATVWRQGLALVRVHPEVVTGLTVPEQFAGSLFELQPDTSYE